MKTNYEIALGEFMPSFRAAAARLMVSKYGISQQRAAELLEITQASVSKYVSGSSPKTARGTWGRAGEELVDLFVRQLMENYEVDAQKAMCTACQRYHRFNCSIMVK